MIVSMVVPAAMETITVLLLSISGGAPAPEPVGSLPASPLSTGSIMNGFTARTSTSLFCATSALSRVQWTPSGASAAAPEGLLTEMEEAGTTPRSSMPRMSAEAMFPAPMKPTRTAGVDDDEDDMVRKWTRVARKMWCKNRANFITFSRLPPRSDTDPPSPPSAPSTMKRRRPVLAEVARLPSSSAAPAPDVVVDLHASLDYALLPSDTALALKYCRDRFSTILPSKARQRPSLLGERQAQLERVCGIPAVPTTVLRSSIGAGQLDGEVAALQADRTARLLKLALGDADYAVAFVEDIRAYVEDRRARAAAAVAAAQGGPSRPAAAASASSSSSAAAASSSSSSSSSSDAGVAARATVHAMDLFSQLANAFPAQVAVGQQDVTHAFATWAARGRPRVVLRCAVDEENEEAGEGKQAHAGASASASSSSSRNAPRGPSSSSSSAPPSPPSPPLPDLLRVLVQTGLLLRRPEGGASSFFFGVPESGPLVAYLRDGRAELVARLGRRAYRECPREELRKASLARSALPIDFHIRDAIGNGLVTTRRTAAGEFVRLVGGGGGSSHR